MVSKINEITEEQFEADVLNSGATIVVDFYGADCVVCQTVAEWLDNMESELTVEVKKIFLESPGAKLAQNYQLRGIPTLIRFENGIEQNRMAGEFSLTQFREFVLAD